MDLGWVFLHNGREGETTRGNPPYPSPTLDTRQMFQGLAWDCGQFVTGREPVRVPAGSRCSDLAHLVRDGAQPPGQRRPAMGKSPQLRQKRKRSSKASSASKSCCGSEKCRSFDECICLNRAALGRRPSPFGHFWLMSGAGSQGRIAKPRW